MKRLMAGSLSCSYCYVAVDDTEEEVGLNVMSLSGGGNLTEFSPSVAVDDTEEEVGLIVMSLSGEVSLTEFSLSEDNLIFLSALQTVLKYFLF